MRSRPRDWAMVVAALGLSLAVGGAPAKAGLSLTIADTTVGNNPGLLTLTIDAGGSYTLTGGAAQTAYKFVIDGDAITAVTDMNGNVNLGMFLSTSANALDFKSVYSTQGAGAKNGFGSFLIDDFQVGPGPSSQIPPITLTAEVEGKGGASDDTLSFVTQSTFSQPLGRPLTLTSTLGPYNVVNDPNAVASFSSTLNGKTTNPLKATQDDPDPGSDSLRVPPVTDPSSVLSNTLTITKLNKDDLVSINAETDALATPEPATLIMALTIPPMVLLLRRRAAAKP